MNAIEVNNCKPQNAFLIIVEIKLLIALTSFRRKFTLSLKGIPKDREMGSDELTKWSVNNEW